MKKFEGVVVMAMYFNESRIQKSQWILLSIVILLAFAISPVNALGQTLLSLPGEETAHPGQEFWIQVGVENVEGLLGFSIVIDLPNTSQEYPLEFVAGSSSVNGTLCKGWSTFENDASKKEGSRLSQAFLINGAGYLPLQGSGVLVKFKLRVKDDAPDQIVPLTFKITGSKVTQLNDGHIPLTFQNGSVRIFGSGITPTPTSEELPTPTLLPSPTPSEFPNVTPSPTEILTPSPTHTPSPTVFHITPTPTFPTGEMIIVTDDLSKMDDLSNGQDYDIATDRCLVIRWDFSNANFNSDEILDIHVWVKKDNKNYDYLGRTANGSATYYEWRKGASRIANPFNSGPSFNHEYQFKVFFLTMSGFPFFFGPYANSGSVEYLQGDHSTPTPALTPTLQPVTTPTITPTYPLGETVIITDDIASMTDLSNGQDYDNMNDRALVIRWNYAQTGINPNDLSDVHVYVRVNQSGVYRYLCRTADGSVEYLEWKDSSPGLSPSFQHGPVFNKTYEFKIYCITKTGIPIFYGPFKPQGSVQFLQGIDPTPTPLGYTPVPTNTPTITPTIRPLTGDEIFITGKVRGLIGGQAIEGARISAGDEITHSGWNGEYQLILPNADVYTIQAQANGYHEFTLIRYFFKNQNMNIRLLPAPPTPTPTPTSALDYSISTVYGFIFDAENYQLVSNAIIKIGDKETVSNSNGFYYIDNITEGEYTIKITASNYQSYEMQFVIDEDMELNIPMESE
jgi:carboxypeptidase-like protein